MITTPEVRQWLAEIASKDSQPDQREKATAALMLLSNQAPVAPVRVCGCDKPGQRCTVHGWVLR